MEPGGLSGYRFDTDIMICMLVSAHYCIKSNG